jgi:hypothetical protein
MYFFIRCSSSSIVKNELLVGLYNTLLLYDVSFVRCAYYDRLYTLHSAVTLHNMVYSTRRAGSNRRPPPTPWKKTRLLFWFCFFLSCLFRSPVAYFIDPRNRLCLSSSCIIFFFFFLSLSHSTLTLLSDRLIDNRQPSRSVFECAHISLYPNQILMCALV